MRESIGFIVESRVGEGTLRKVFGEDTLGKGTLGKGKFFERRAKVNGSVGRKK